MLVPVIILLISCCVGLYFAISDDEAGMSAIMVFSLALFLAILLAIISDGVKAERKTSLNHIKVKIRIESINGIETSRDTVYIFTPKKK